MNISILHRRKVPSIMSLSLDFPTSIDPALQTLRSLLTRGRHAEADRMVRKCTRVPSIASARQLLALRAEIALGLGRFAAALEWSVEGLKSPDPGEGREAALEGFRIRALLGLARFREAEGRVETRFAALDPQGADLGLFRAQVALHSGGLNPARAHATAACDAAAASRQRGKLVEALMLRARVGRETGDAAGAREDLDRARRLGNGLRDASALAAVLSDRADLMAHSGEWNAAAIDARQSGQLFARVFSPQEHLSAGRRAGLLGLAQSEPNAALLAIERAADTARRGFGTIAGRAEIDLLLADAHLAGRDSEGALDRATLALSFFRQAQDPAGLARAHVRRSLAALSVPNLGLAYREARTAAAIHGAGPVALGLADIALGRVLMRKERPLARAPFERAAANHSLYPPLRAVAQIGVALAQGASLASDAVQSPLSAIDAFGDRRILAIVRSDMRELFCAEPCAPYRAEVTQGGWPGERNGHSDSDEEFLPGLLGASDPVRLLGELVRKAAPSSLPVLIYGETGTGKEKIAKAIHDLSPRAGREFVAINAASLSDELFESELFGHVRGSFTGASTDRPGLVERAKGGTLFIDEVADLTPRSQVRLLRFVQEGTFRKVGENFERRAEVRIVVASNQRLEDLVAARQFREDLLHRLRGVCVIVPPLRTRAEDIVRLARHFVAASSSRSARLSPLSEAELRRHSWPGNVRELEQEMRRAVVLADAPSIEWRCPKPAPALEATRAEVGLNPSTSLHEALGGFERTFLKSVLAQCAERAEAARRLGISRQALHQKVLRFGL